MTALLSTFKARSYAGEVDLPAIAELINFCKTADNQDGLVTVDELRDDYADPDFDVDRDLRLWTNATGALCAVASCWFPEPAEVKNGYFGFSIHPSAREQGIEEDIFSWAEALVKDLAQAHQRPARLRTGARDDYAFRLNWLTRKGFTSDRTFYQMMRSLSEPIPQPQLPDGFTIRPLQGEAEVAAWVEMFNQSFIDHWNFTPLTVESRAHWLTETSYQPELDLVAVAPDGTLAAFCYAIIHAEENTLTGQLEGWIADLGTRRGFRRMGLGRAMLLTGLHTLQAHGMNTALLGVDSENPSGALALYQSVGFQKRHTSFAFVKDLD
ncbi:MAG: GNAT family N-acetyltransferase [Leptolyngbyaceae cyanobacterium bins.302]|nr:GNAT family N-acetyltransferase [Leptolyngbyaceae cyanobacterium bins.302]